ncbi:MAG: ABC transporter ATP-binding protein [Anaerolineaceae bacterium]|nr:ABC transporter ATP-binding protein [Anaerolineaceae bacterium]
MIEVENLTKHFGTHLAVDHVSFTAQPGEIVGLLGPNGAGKTTTMRMLTGFMPPSDGTARVAGFDVLADSLAVRQSVGYLPEHVPVYPDMTVYGYISFWARLRGVRNVRQHVDAALERVQLTDRRKMLVRHLSKGLTQRLGLAQALVHDPPVIILDEPTIGIDPQQVIEVRDTIRQLGENHTVLFSTHILSEAEQVCDRVVIIQQGRVVAQGAPATLRQQLQSGAHLYVEVRGANEAKIREILNPLRDIQAIEPQGNGFSLRVKPGKDLRAAVAERVMAAGVSLLELRPVAMTLEDIFLDIIKRN